MFMKGQTTAATQAAEGRPPAERGSVPALGGLLTSPAVPHEQRSNDSGGCSPPEIFTQKGTEDNWICVYNLCILLGFSNFGMLWWLSSTHGEVERHFPRKSWPHGTEALPFSTKHQRAEREGELGTMSTLYLQSCMMQTSPSVFGKSGIIGRANTYTESHWIRLYVVIPSCVR